RPRPCLPRPATEESRKYQTAHPAIAWMAPSPTWKVDSWTWLAAALGIPTLTPADATTAEFLVAADTDPKAAPVQRPLKDQYRQDPGSSRITLTAHGTQADAPIACSIDLGRAIYNAQAHKGVGGAGTGACSGDLLLGALAACAQITCQMVAAAMGIPTEAINVRVEGELDLQGTLGLSKDLPVGFQDIRVTFDVRAPQAT